DLRGPIVVPHLPVLGVHGLKDQSSGTTLDAAVTVAADLIDGVQQLLPVETPLPISVHRTDFFDAAGAAETALAPVEHGAFGQRGETGRYPAHVDMIFGRQPSFS